MAVWYAPACVGHHIAPEDDDSGDEGVNLPDHDEDINFDEPDESVHDHLMVHFLTPDFTDIKWEDDLGDDDDDDW